MINTMDRQVRQWRRQDKIDAALDLLALVTVKLVWWGGLFAAGYIAACVIKAGGAA
jgi:hypothetical protein